MQTREEVEVLVAAVGVADFDDFQTTAADDVGFAAGRSGGCFFGGALSPGFGDGGPEAWTDEGVDDVDLAELGGEGRGEEGFGVFAGVVGEAVDEAGEEGDGFEVGEGFGEVGEEVRVAAGEAEREELEGEVGDGLGEDREFVFAAGGDEGLVVWEGDVGGEGQFAEVGGFRREGGQGE